MKHIVFGAAGWLTLGVVAITLNSGCGNAEELCNKMVDKMEECIPATMEEQMAKVPEGAKEMAEKMKAKLEEGQKEAIAEARKACKDAKGKAASDGDKIKACLEKKDCKEYNKCILSMGGK